MIDLKGNFKSSNKGNLQCDLCEEKNSVENQTHLLQCTFFIHHPELKTEIDSIEYEDIFKSLSSQIRAVKVWKKLLFVRKVKLGIK